MIDFANITAHAGDGGNGTGSFRHIKGKRYGKADGGNGGNGGSVYLVASRDLNTLEPYRFVKDYKAQSGQNGSSNLRRGADSEDLILKVPIGTQVKVTSAKGEVISQKLSTIHYSLITDLVAESDKVLVARGGQGGRGNAYLRDEYGRRPRQAELGEEGEKVTLTLELKLIADVGLIGLPNAGKSTLLAALTAARPKIAAYPFTTLEPNLGVLTPTANGKRQTANGVKQSAISGKHLILADIPGLIENASLGRGLGVQFLRHIERTTTLVYLIELAPHQNRDAFEALFKQANDDALHYGSADQMAIYKILGFHKQQKYYRVKIKNTPIYFKKVTCSILNETRSTTITPNTHMIHYKGGWQTILIDGGYFTKNRPRIQSKEMYFTYLMTFHNAVKYVNTISRMNHSYKYFNIKVSKSYQILT